MSILTVLVYPAFLVLFLAAIIVANLHKKLSTSIITVNNK